MYSGVKMLSAVILGLVVLGLEATAYAGGVAPQAGAGSGAPAPAESGGGPSWWVLAGAIVGVVVAVLGGLKAALELKKARLELAKVKSAAAEEAPMV